MTELLLNDSTILFGTLGFVPRWMGNAGLQIGSDVILVVKFMVFASPYPCTNFAIC